MNIRKKANPLDIIFIEKNHTYKSSLGSHISVTTALKDYQQPFPPDAAQKYARKHSMDLQYVLSCWSDQKRLGLEIGSWLHLYIENRIQNKIPDLSYILTKEKTIEKQLIKDQYIINYTKQVEDYIKTFDYENYLASEVIVGNNKYAGQIDHLFSNRIQDIKNDKQIKFNNPYQKMKYPFDDLDDCNWNKYCLQINFYHYLLPDTIKSSFNKPHQVISFNRNSDKYRVYDIPNLQHRIKEII